MKTIFETIFGSKLYGLDNEDSDDDFRGVFLPSPKDILLGRVKDTVESTTGVDYKKNKAGDVDRTSYSLRKFVELLCIGDTGAFEMIHASPEKWLQQSPIWEELHSRRHEFYTSSLTGLFEYARLQASKFGIRGSRVAALRLVVDAIAHIDPADTKTKLGDIADLLPLNEFSSFSVDEKQRAHCQDFYNILERRYQFTMKASAFKECIHKLWDTYGERARLAEANAGADWKALSHALRCGYQLRDVYMTGDYHYPLKQSDFIRSVKAGDVSFADVKESLESLIGEIEKLAAVSTYPASPDVVKWESWVAAVYLNHINENKPSLE